MNPYSALVVRFLAAAQALRLNGMHPRHRFIQCYTRQGRVAVLVEFGHETVLIAGRPEFVELSRDVAVHIAVLNPPSTQALLRQRYVKDPAISVEAALTAVATLVGETITITRFIRWDTEPPPALEPAVGMRQRRA